MPDHDRQRAFIDQLLEHAAVHVTPLLRAQRVQRRDAVLISVIRAIAGKMLHACGHPVRLHAADHRLEQWQYVVRIVTEPPVIHHRVVQVRVQVRHGRECPVHAEARRFERGRLALRIGELYVVGRPKRHRIGEPCKAVDNTARAVLHVATQKQRLPIARGFTESIAFRPDPFRVVAVAVDDLGADKHVADRVIAHERADLISRRHALVGLAHHLPELLLDAHRGESVLDPAGL